MSVQQLRLHPFEGLLFFISGISSDPLPLGNTFDPIHRLRTTCLEIIEGGKFKLKNWGLLLVLNVVRPVVILCALGMNLHRLWQLLGYFYEQNVQSSPLTGSFIKTIAASLSSKEGEMFYPTNGWLLTGSEFSMESFQRSNCWYYPCRQSSHTMVIASWYLLHL